MKQILKIGNKVHLKREEVPSVVRQKTHYLSDGSSVYYQVFSDGIVLTGYYNSNGVWSAADPAVINEFFELSGVWELYPKPIVVDGHAAGILRKTWEELNLNLNEPAMKEAS